MVWLFISTSMSVLIYCLTPTTSTGYYCIRHAMYCGVVYTTSFVLGGSGVVAVLVVRTSGARVRRHRLGILHEPLIDQRFMQMLHRTPIWIALDAAIEFFPMWHQ